MIRVVSEPGALALLNEGIATLEGAGIDTARQDAESLLAWLLDVERFSVYLDRARVVPAATAARYRALIGRRTSHEPLQYLTGFEEFCGVRLSVTPEVLIPRPETEGLVEWALEILRERPAPMIADLGTGSGAIACALAKSLPGLCAVAVERSVGALAVASVNVRRLGLSQRVRLLAGDLLEPIGTAKTRLDLVIANPPYVPSAAIGSLPREVSEFEPRQALDGGADGMAVIRRIITAAPPVLRPRGWLMMEIGEDQAGPLASLMAAEGFTGIQARRDLRGVERYIGGQWAEALPAARRGSC